MIDEAIVTAKKEHLSSLSEECDIPLEELDKIVLPIIDSCTKDAISVSFFSVSANSSLLLQKLLTCARSHRNVNLKHG